MKGKRFAGNAEACINHLVAYLAEKKELLEELRAMITQICNVDEQTAYYWLTGRHLPIGVNMIKMQHIVSKMGYHVNELESMNPAVRILVEMIAYDLLSFEDIMKHLSINKRQTLFHNLHGRSRPEKESLRKMQEIGREYLELTDKERDVKIPMLFGQPDESMIQKEKPPENLSHEGTLKKLADLILQVGSLAEVVASDEFTPQERKHLRELTHVDGVHIAVNHLMRLTSESSRNDLSEFISQKV